MGFIEHFMCLPVLLSPVAPTLEQNAPGVTGLATAAFLGVCGAGLAGFGAGLAAFVGVLAALAAFGAGFAALAGFGAGARVFAALLADAAGRARATTGIAWVGTRDAEASLSTVCIGDGALVDVAGLGVATRWGETGAAALIGALGLATGWSSGGPPKAPMAAMPTTAPRGIAKRLRLHHGGRTVPTLVD